MITPAPSPAPAVPPRPQGNLDQATAAEINAMIDRAWRKSQPRTWQRRKGIEAVLNYLARFPGDTWQERWQSSDMADGSRRIRDLRTGTMAIDGELGHSLMLLCCLRVIRPSIAGFRANRFVRYNEQFEVVQADPALNRFIELVEQEATSPHFKRCARRDIAGALTTQSVVLSDLTAEGLLYYARETRAGGWGGGYEQYVGHLAWKVLHQAGHFPPHVPATLRGAMRSPARSPRELVDYHELNNVEVADMLTSYLTRRSHDVDYVTLRGLAADLCGNFWKQIERIRPTQPDLALTSETYQAWLQALSVRRDGQPRQGADAIMTNVRALYLDLQGWAASEPEKWARWAAPCPIPSSYTRSRAKAKRRTKERMDARIRTLQPLMPAFVAAARERRDHMSELLTVASNAGGGEQFVVDSRRYTRLFTAGDARHEQFHGRANVRVTDNATGKPLNVTFKEDAAFWQWATIATLQHTGLRCEELLELSQLSIRQYARPNGEVVALLVVAPSKTDRERVIPMSADLFHVIATIIRRPTRTTPHVPLATRYDKAEHVTSEPQPFLFQRTIGQRTEVITSSALRDELFKLCDILAAEHPDLRNCRFTPHDFRRLFATDLVNHGLPIHIGAALLGHLDIQSTQGYVTVFQEDVIRHYQAHLARRRTARPSTEYRPASADEWDEFELHFDKRNVELGQCGRPYSTPCEHEHACIRCPMLQVEPKMIDRLNEIREDLTSRRTRAETEGWLGELDGIDLTLRFLEDKRADARRLAGLKPINLGMPALRT